MAGENPFGVNLTKRLVSPGGEKLLYNPFSVRGGSIELVDYMGGDEMVERVATAGHGRSIFPENPDKIDFIEHLAVRGIADPFRSVQLKLSIRSPIDVALALVYAKDASVNEYSGRYSVMLNTAHQPTVEEIVSSLATDVKDRNGTAQAIYDIVKNGREKALEHYSELIELNLARELARIGLGTDNDTQYFWKIDLFSLADFLGKQSKNHAPRTQTRDYLDGLAKIAAAIAPISWGALTQRDIHPIRLTMPIDDRIIDGPLSPASWTPEETRRITVPALEEMLFVSKPILEHGAVQAVDYMGDDSAFAQAARTSYGKGTKTLQDDKSLIKSLIRDLHTSPIEMCEFAVESKTPVFVDLRQSGRHRTLDKHCFMGYLPKGSQFYIPPNTELKYQDRKNRQGRAGEMEEDEKLASRISLTQSFHIEKANATMIRNLGGSEELARSQKGVGFFTKMWRTGDSHNWGHFLMLRLDSHAQKEVRDYAEVVNEIHRAHTPTANEALCTYVIDGMRLSTKEIGLLRSMMRDDIDLESLETYKGVGFVVQKRDADNNPVFENGVKVMELGREGIAFKNKVLGLLKKL